MNLPIRFFTICVGLVWCTLCCESAPRHVYLTWQGDTSTTITVNFQTMEDGEGAQVYYDTKPRKGKLGEYRFHSAGTKHTVLDLADNRLIHWVELVSLQPGRTYYFVAGDEQSGFSTERKFRTIPDGRQRLRFVDGGDMGTGPDMSLLLKQAARQEPNFATVGGDLAYAGDMPTNYAKWDAWLDAWEQCMVTPKGFTIPMVLAIGNHEVRGGVGNSVSNAVFYFGYFAQEQQRSYYSRRFGKNFAIYLLDSGHIARHGPEQAAWLEAQMEADADLPFHFAVYHVPLYPTYRAYGLPGSVAGRNTWLPIFDRHHLTAAFEHHDHVFKRTKLLRNDKIDPHGTLYLGDGCWGMGARPLRNQPSWYHEKAASIQHFWRVDVSKRRVEYRAINKEGKIFDVYPPDLPEASSAEKIFSSLARPIPASSPPTTQN